MKKKKTNIYLATCFLFACLMSCKGPDEEGKIAPPYDSNKPIIIESFDPTQGGMAERVIIAGENFGNNKDNIRVWFNNKRASIIGTNGTRIYLVAPRQPGDTCVISVAIGNDSVVASEKFIYNTTLRVTTIAGQHGTKTFAAGALASATFNLPQRITIDHDGNMFGGHRSPDNVIWMLNEEKDVVMQLPNGNYKVGAPTLDVTGKMVTFPDDGGSTYYEFDAELQWVGRVRQILPPTPEEVQEGKKEFKIDWKTSLATCELDGFIYTYGMNGQLVKFDPRTRKGELVTTLVSGTQGMLEFHPRDKNMLYIAMIQNNSIYRYDVLSGNYELYAGSPNVSGWRDGDRKSALIGEVGQFVFDDDYNLVFSDAGNHCIRQITPEGQVETLIGQPGIAGYQDGDPKEALFNYPRGMCIDKNYTIYISDTNNNCIRKLSIE